jgi:hypothetical protein
MSGRWQALANTLDVLFSGNFPDYYIQARNRTFTRPTAPKTTGPPRFVYYDYSADANDVTSVDRTRQIQGSIGGLTFVQGNGGDVTADFLDRLETIADAWAETPEAGQLYFYGVAPQELVYGGNAEKPEWCVREWTLPFLYVSPLSAEGESILGGISSGTFEVQAPSLAALDFVGFDAKSDPKAWRRVRAVEGEPSCSGFVSLALDSGARKIVTSGWVRIPSGHGFPEGPLYLSQSTAGAAVSEPPQEGVVRKVAEVINATDLVIVSGPEVVE